MLSALEHVGTGRMEKYEPLRRLLVPAPHPIHLTFADLAALVGGLPPSAYRRREWWSNNPTGHVQAQAWLSAGRRVDNVDLLAERVWFSPRMP